MSLNFRDKDPHSKDYNFKMTERNNSIVKQ